MTTDLEAPVPVTPLAEAMLGRLSRPSVLPDCYTQYALMYDPIVLNNMYEHDFSGAYLFQLARGTLSDKPEKVASAIRLSGQILSTTGVTEDAVRTYVFRLFYESVGLRKPEDQTVRDRLKALFPLYCAPIHHWQPEQIRKFWALADYAIRPYDVPKMFDGPFQIDADTASSMNEYFNAMYEPTKRPRAGLLIMMALTTNGEQWKYIFNAFSRDTLDALPGIASENADVIWSAIEAGVSVSADTAKTQLQKRAFAYALLKHVLLLHTQRVALPSCFSRYLVTDASSPHLWPDERIVNVLKSISEKIERTYAENLGPFIVKSAG